MTIERERRQAGRVSLVRRCTLVLDDARDTDHPRLRDFLKASAVVAAQPSKK